MEKDPTIKDVIETVESSSTDFERLNNDLKRRYLIWNIEAFNIIASKVNVAVGTFGTGYPFYALDESLEGTLPVIDEQIRYNRQLVRDGEPYQKSIWLCKSCLKENGDTMPDLKKVCKPCPNTPNTLKPRKIINRLPDIDMWLVCEDGKLPEAEEQLSALLQKFGMQTSDVDPSKSIEDVYKITKMLRQGKVPEIFLPIDAHIVEYSQIKNLIKKAPVTILESTQKGIKPYLPIHPKSYRKTWQYDDEAYNFIYDYLSAFHPFNFPQELQETLDKTRSVVAKAFSEEDLFKILLQTATDSNYRRYGSIELEQRFLERMRSWQKIKDKTAETPQQKIKTLDRER